MRKNVLIVTLDDAGHSDVGFAGFATGAKTPNFDRECRRGMRLNSFFGQPVCSLARWSFVTGQLPAHKGIYTTLFNSGAQNDQWNANSGVTAAQQTIYTLAKAAGCRTINLGKHHFGAALDVSSIADHSIDYVEGWALPTAYGGGPITPKYNGSIVGGQLVDLSVYRDRDTNVAKAFIDQTPQGSTPWFATVNFHAPHYPLAWDQSWMDAVVGKNETKKTRDGDVFTDQEGRQSTRAHYLAAIYGTDLAFGAMIDHLKATGQYDDTIILFFADNGPLGLNNPQTSGDQAGEPSPNFRGSKGSIYNGGICVPSFVSGAGIPKGETDTIIGFHDILPTLFSHLGVAYDAEQTDGEDMSDVWAGAQRERTKPIFWMTVQGMPKGTPSCHRSPQMRLHSPVGHAGVAAAHDVFFNYQFNIKGPRLEIYRPVTDDPAHEKNLTARVAESVRARYLAVMHEKIEEIQAVGEPRFYARSGVKYENRTPN